MSVGATLLTVTWNWALVVPPSSSLIVTVTVYTPLSAYVWLPSNDPAVGAPGEPGTSIVGAPDCSGVPSPQLMA